MHKKCIKHIKQKFQLELETKKSVFQLTKICCIHSNWLDCDIFPSFPPCCSINHTLNHFCFRTIRLQFSGSFQVPLSNQWFYINPILDPATYWSFWGASRSPLVLVGPILAWSMQFLLIDFGPYTSLHTLDTYTSQFWFPLPTLWPTHIPFENHFNFGPLLGS